MAQKPFKIPDDILTRIEVDPVTNCWIWKLSKYPDGYGRANYKGQAYRAHRLSAHENMDDMYNADRGPVGEKAGLAKLTWDQVREIRTRYKPFSRGPNNQVSLAKEFGVVQTIISRVVRKETWK